MLGAASGAVAGLVAITPAAGFVRPLAAIVIGGVAGIVCFYAVVMKSRLRYDDSLDVVGVHGVGGTWGAVATGLFASKAVNADGRDGLVLGDASTLEPGCRYCGHLALCGGNDVDHPENLGRGYGPACLQRG